MASGDSSLISTQGKTSLTNTWNRFIETANMTPEQAYQVNYVKNWDWGRWAKDFSSRFFGLD